MNPPKSMTLSKLKQSELKRFDLAEYHQLNCDYLYGKDSCSCLIKEIKKQLNLTIEKAYALGKEEKGIKAVKEKADELQLFLNKLNNNRSKDYFTDGVLKGVKMALDFIKS